MSNLKKNFGVFYIHNAIIFYQKSLRPAFKTVFFLHNNHSKASREVLMDCVIEKQVLNGGI